MRDLQKMVLTYISVTTIALTLVLAFSGSRLGLLTPESYGDISVEQAKALIESNPSLVIVDVRTSSEFDLGHIENAIDLCVCNVEELLLNLEPRDEILVYCLSGIRSMKAMMILNENGYYKVYNLLGGITEWTEQGYQAVGG